MFVEDILPPEHRSFNNPRAHFDADGMGELFHPYEWRSLRNG